MEILFRAKSKGDEMWRHGSIVSDKKGGYAIIQVRDNPISNGCANGWCFGVIPETVGQFTGTKDELNVKIFKGDICEVTYYNHSSPNTKIIQEVIFENGCFVLRAKNHLGLQLEDARLYVPLYYSNAPNKIKVIGNIHDNPELLK